MNLSIPFELVQSQCPELLPVIVRHRQQSGSKAVDKSADLSVLTYTIAWCKEVQGMGLAELLNRPRRVVQPALSVDRLLDEEMACVRGVSLCWRQNRYYGSFLLTDPDWALSLIRARLRPDLESQVQEAHRITGLSPDQRAVEVRTALSSLMGDKGFVALQIRKQ